MVEKIVAIDVYEKIILTVVSGIYTVYSYKEAISAIEKRGLELAIQVSNSYTPVKIKLRNGKKYLTTDPDETIWNNLSNTRQLYNWGVIVESQQ